MEELPVIDQTLTYRQLFNLRPTTLEKRIREYYYTTQNNSLTIKYILTLRIRHQLGAEEFALILKDLVHEIFMSTKATRTMKRFFYYFQDYFMAPEWKALKHKLIGRHSSQIKNKKGKQSYETGFSCDFYEWSRKKTRLDIQEFEEGFTDPRYQGSLQPFDFLRYF